MNQTLKPSPMEESIVDLVPLLLERDCTADRFVIGDADLHKSWDLGVIWPRWDRVVDGWEAAQVADLNGGLSYFERMLDRQFGSVPPVANLFHSCRSMVDPNERDRFVDWVLGNTVNDYTPYGTSNHGARSLKELESKEDARFAREQAIAALARA